jgi:AraC-like DNA-binding protein
MPSNVCTKLDKMSRLDRRDLTPSRALLSPQVAAARTFFLDLASGRRRGRSLTLAMGGWERCRSDYALVRRRFPYFVIEYVVAGRGWVILDGVRRSVGPGEVFAYGPATAVELHCVAEQPLEKYFFALTGSGVAARLQRCGVAVGAPRSLVVSPEAMGVAEEVVRAAVPGGPMALRLAEALLEVWLLRLEESATRRLGVASDPVHAAFLRSKALIDARAEVLGSLAEMASLVKVEPSTLGRWFRTYQGTSPYQYLLRRKMNLAAEFLLASDGLVKEAAARVGFSDPDHFSRVFRAVHGVPPRRLRVGRAEERSGRLVT